MPADKITITKADASHAAPLTALSITTFRDTFGPSNKQEHMDKYIAEEMTETKLTDELNDNDNQFYLAWHDGAMAGYVKLRTNKKPEELKNNNPMEIERLYVLHEHHGKKIGAALMSHCLKLAAENGHDVIWLGVWEHNHKAVRFYKQWGFELFGEHIFQLGDDAQTDVLMRKNLSPITPNIYK